MTFGQALKQLLSISGVKSTHLADALGYDTSYISRWTNDLKIPSLKNNDELFDKISYTILRNCSEAGTDNLRSIYGVESQHDLQSAITEELKISYKSSVNASELQSITPNAVLMPSTSVRNMNEQYINAILRSSLNTGSDTVSCISTTRLSKYSNRDTVFWPTIMNHPDIKGRVSLMMHQIVDMSDFSRNIDAYCAAICTFSCLPVELKYEFYDFEADSSQPTPDMMIIGENMLNLSICNNISKSNYVLVCSDRPLIAAIASSVKNQLKFCRRLLTYSMGGELQSTHFLYDFVMDGYLCYLLNIMHPIYMPDDMAESWMQRYTPEFIDDDFQVSYNSLCSKASKEVLVYRSALLDYIYNGTMFTSGRIITVSKEDRAVHLNQLLNNIEQGGMRFGILNDTNPLLCRKDMKLSIYLSKNNGFAVSADKDTFGMSMRFTSNQTVKNFNIFFRNLFGQSSEYVVCGKDAEDFIRRGLLFM